MKIKITSKAITIIFISIIIIFNSCTSQESHKNINVQKEDSIVWKEDICPKCNGIGKLRASIATRIYLGIITLGSGATIQTEECSLCNGSGVICKRILL